MTRQQHIIWDWNGTLLNDVQACAGAINVLLARRGLPPITLEQYLDVFDFPVRNYYLRLGFDFSRDRWDDVAVEYHDAYARLSVDSPLRDGARAALDSLKCRGIGVSVLSACETGLLKRMMGERDVLDCFEHVYGLSDFFAHSKLDLGHALLKNAGLSRTETLLVGDTTHDHDVAQALGIPCILMTGGHQSASKLVRLGCPVVADFAEALQLIR
ncbi:MAG: HAD family hydrolase [bacterium]